MLNNMYSIVNPEDPYWQSFLLFFYNMHTTTSARCFLQYRRSAMEILNNIGGPVNQILESFYDYCRKHGFRYDHNALTKFNVMKLKWLECFRVGDLYGADDFTSDELILIINLITEHANYYKDKIKTLEHGK